MTTRRCDEGRLTGTLPVRVPKPVWEDTAQGEDPLTPEQKQQLALRILDALKKLD